MSRILVLLQYMSFIQHVPVYHLELVFEEVCKMPKVNVNIKNIQFIWTTAKRKSTWWWSELYKLILNKKQRCLLRALTDIHKVYICPYIISSTYYMLRFHKTMISLTRKIYKQNGLELSTVQNLIRLHKGRWKKTWYNRVIACSIKNSKFI